MPSVSEADRRESSPDVRTGARGWGKRRLTASAREGRRRSRRGVRAEAPARRGGTVRRRVCHWLCQCSCVAERPTQKAVNCARPLSSSDLPTVLKLLPVSSAPPDGFADVDAITPCIVLHGEGLLVPVGPFLFRQAVQIRLEKVKVSTVEFGSSQ